eukprot:5965875-Amphidinium_carterae.1
MWGNRVVCSNSANVTLLVLDAWMVCSLANLIGALTCKDVKSTLVPDAAVHRPYVPIEVMG